MTDSMTAVIFKTGFYDWLNGKNLPKWEVFILDVSVPRPRSQVNPAPVSDYFTAKLSKCTSVPSTS